MEAQTTFKGVRLNGITSRDVLPSDVSMGLVLQYRANKGVQLSGTNVFAWNNLVGNINYNALQYISTNQPTSIFFGTNMSGTPMKSVFFMPVIGTTGIINLRADNVAPLFSGIDKGFTLAIVMNGQTNAAVIQSSMAWSGATNLNASRWQFRPNNTTPSQSVFFKASNTNSTAFQPALSGGISTNIWSIHVVTYDGANLVQYSNLTPNRTDALVSGVQTTYDRFVIGGSVTSNLLNSAWSGAIAEYRLYTNGLTGIQVTNLVKELNKTYTLF